MPVSWPEEVADDDEDEDPVDEDAVVEDTGAEDVVDNVDVDEGLVEGVLREVGIDEDARWDVVVNGAKNKEVPTTAVSVLSIARR